MIFNLREHYLWQQFSYRRSQSAFRRLYDLYTEQLFQLALQLTAGHRKAAEGLVQNTWILVIEKQSLLSAKGDIKSSLFELLVHSSKRHYEQHNDYILVNEEPREHIFPGIASAGHIKTSLGFLPVGYRHVFVLHDIMGCRHSRISSLLQISERNSRSQLFHARKMLKQFFPGKDQYAEWTSAELQVLRSAYSSCLASPELKERVTEQLMDRAFIVTAARNFTQLNFLQSLLRNPLLFSK
jgi:RNA polymerase sigma-70 factor, ECF subfamily